MSLLDRLRGTEAPRLNAHGFQAAMFEWADGAGEFSRTTIISNFALTEDDKTELDQLKTIWDLADTDLKKIWLKFAFDDIVLLVSDRDLSFYLTNASIVARLNQAVS